MYYFKQKWPIPTGLCSQPKLCRLYSLSAAFVLQLTIFVFFQFNFVNGVVIEGGVQFDTITRHVEEHLKSSIKRKMKNVQNIEIQTGDVKSHLWVFINADYPFFMVNHSCKVCDCVCVCVFLKCKLCFL